MKKRRKVLVRNVRPTFTTLVNETIFAMGNLSEMLATFMLSMDLESNNAEANENLISAQLHICNRSSDLLSFICPSAASA